MIYEKMGALEIARVIRERQAKPSEIYAHFLARIDELGPRLNAFISVSHEGLERAKELDDMEPRGLLFGVPVAIKDNICTQELPTTCGSKMLENFRPPYDATVIARLKAQGALIIGKTNMDEFAMGASGESSRFGAPRNPHDITRTPGGSSGGSAAAVAAGLAPCALGSDTGGSIRQPAGFCGLVGYKPTYGAVSRYGGIAYANSFDQIGPITRTVADAALLAAVISGHDRLDAMSDPRYAPDFSDILEDRALSLKGRKIGLLRGLTDDASADARAAVMRATDAYAAMGAEIIDISVPAIEHSLPVYYIIALCEASSNLAKFGGVQFGYRAPDCDDVESLYIRSRSEAFGREIKKRIILGTYMLGADNYSAYYKKARAMQAVLRAQFDRAFEACDIMLTPVAPAAAHKIGGRQDLLDDACTVPVNLAGLPAVSVPCARDAGGMPIGAQIIGRRFGDAQMLAFARELERELSGGETA